MVERATVQQGDITKEKQNTNRGVEKGYEELKEMYGERISFPPVIVDETTLICVILCD